VLISTIAATLAGAITYLAHMAQWAAIFGGRSQDDEEGGRNPLVMILFAILAPIAAMLVQFAVSRSREFQADASGARLAGRTYGLARLSRRSKSPRASSRCRRLPPPRTCSSSIPDGAELRAPLLHASPTEERIARLRAMRLG